MIIDGNNIFYTNTALVCATNDTSQQIQWTVASDFNSRLILTRYYSYTMDTVIPSDFNSFLIT